MAVEQLLWPDDVPFTGVPIVNFDAGVVSDVTQVRIYNDRNDPGSGVVLRNCFIQLVAQNPSIPTEKVQGGIAPLDELWGEIRFVDASTTIDSYITDWVKVGNTSVLTFPEMIADSYRTFEMRFTPPSFALTNPYTFFILIHANDKSVGIPGPGVDIHRGIMTGFGDARQTTFLSGGRVTANVVNDDGVNTAAGVMMYEGREIALASELQTIDENDGASPPEELEIGESYFLEFTRDSSGVLVINKGLRSATPILPVTPIDEVFECSIRIDFVGVATAPIIGDEDITNTEVYGHHYTRVLTGLSIRLYGGNVISSGSWRPVGRFEDFTLTASSDNFLWSRGDGSFTITLDAILLDTSSDLLYIYTTDTVNVTLIDDKRILIDENSALVMGAMGFNNPGGTGGPHIDITSEGVFAGWTDAVITKVSGGIVADPLDVTSASFVVPITGWYRTDVMVNFSSVDVGDVLILNMHVNNSPTVGYEFAILSVSEARIVPWTDLVLLTALDEVDIRITNSSGDGTTGVNLHGFFFSIELKIRGV